MSVDVYRDTPVRLLGYANEVGEAFRSLVRVQWVYLSYGISSVYVVADTIDKTLKTSRQVPMSEKGRSSRLWMTALDTLVWQGLASVLIPGLTINRVCALSLLLLSRAMPKVAETKRRVATTTLGLAVIPCIVQPIDDLVHAIMDRTTRKLTHDNNPSNE